MHTPGKNRHRRSVETRGTGAGGKREAPGGQVARFASVREYVDFDLLVRGLFFLQGKTRDPDVYAPGRAVERHEAGIRHEVFPL
jgi:hypothetical protein